METPKPVLPARRLSGTDNVGLRAVHAWEFGLGFTSGRTHTALAVTVMSSLQGYTPKLRFALQIVGPRAARPGTQLSHHPGIMHANMICSVSWSEHTSESCVRP